MPSKPLSEQLKTDRALYLSAILLYLILALLTPRFGHSWDTYCWEQWTALIQKHGLGAAYANGSPVNYLPLFLYVLKGFSYFVSPEQLHDAMYLLKPISLLFDFGSILIILKLLPAGAYRIALLLAGMLNPGFIYNTYIWNQVDGVLSFFVMLSLLLAVKRKTTLSAFAFLLAFNFKLQAIVFMPLLGLLWLPELSLKKTAGILAMLGICQSLIVLPFVLSGHGKNMIAVVFNSVDYFSFVSMNAYNMWYFIFSGELNSMSDTVSLGGIVSAKQLGLFLFFAASALVLAPLMHATVNRMRKTSAYMPGMEQILMTAALLICFFFYFNTQMHERYIHPLMVFSTALAFVYKRWLQWVLFSICYVLSLESICHYTGYTLIPEDWMNPRFLAAGYAAGICLLLAGWIRLKPFKTAN